MSEEELYKLLNIPNKPWIELTDEETQLFEKNNNYIKQLQQENKQLIEIIQKAINRISLIRMDNDTSIESNKLLNDVLNNLRGKEDK